MTSNTMQTTPKAKKITTPEVNQTNTPHVDQQQTRSNKQEDSLIRIFYARFKWSDTLELLGCISLILIIYVASCEMMQFCMQNFNHALSDIFRYRHQCVPCFIMLIISCLTAVIITIASSILLVIVIRWIFFACVNYYYVEGRNSYKWWQEKTIIEFIIISIMLLIWIMIVFELGILIMANFNEKSISEDRFFIYRVTGLLGITFHCFLIGLIISS